MRCCNRSQREPPDAGGALKLNLFLVPLDDHHTCFRYHHLFSQFLLDLLRRKYNGEYIKRHRLAGQYYISIGSMDEAINHMFAQDMESAVNLLEAYANRA